MRTVTTETKSQNHDVDAVFDVVENTLQYAREREYTGWDYFDGLSSRLLRAIPLENKWLNLAVQEGIKRAPINLRSPFLVEQRQNYKGTALFTLANLNACEIQSALGRSASPSVNFSREARELADWLVDNRLDGYSGYCAGYQHEMQELHRKRSPDEGDIVSTSYGVKALLAAAELDREYANLAATSRDFVVEDLDYSRTESGARIDYVVSDTGQYFVPNAIAIGARIFLDLYDFFGRDEDLERATELLDYVVELQTDRGGWMYMEPPSESHLSMDNHHNGFIIECLQRYEQVADARYEKALSDALDFYKQVLFESSGAPNWDESSRYPKDIHAVAQGILVFTAAEDLQFAGRIVDWALSNLYAGSGRFYFRKHRFYTKRITLMRWCQAWMAYALSEYAVARLRAGHTDRIADRPGVVESYDETS